MCNKITVVCSVTPCHLVSYKFNKVLAAPTAVNVLCPQIQAAGSFENSSDCYQVAQHNIAEERCIFKKLIFQEDKSSKNKMRSKMDKKTF